MKFKNAKFKVGDIVEKAGNDLPMLGKVRWVIEELQGTDHAILYCGTITYPNALKGRKIQRYGHLIRLYNGETNQEENEDLKPLTLHEENIVSTYSAMKHELFNSMKNWPPMNSAHEGYGVLLEEVDELWDHVKTNQKKRDLDKMKKEAIQVAAMAMRFAIEVCNEERGRK